MPVAADVRRLDCREAAPDPGAETSVTKEAGRNSPNTGEPSDSWAEPSNDWEPIPGEGPETGESFESATPVSVNQLRADTEQAGPKPSLESLLAQIPEQNRHNVEELFRGRFTTVRKLDRSKLH